MSPEIYPANVQEHAQLGRVVGVINIAGGGCDAGSVARMSEVFAAAGIPGAKVVGVQPDGLEHALTDAAESSDVVVVLGGDGTIRTAAAICGKAGRPLIPLAGGTLNMLPHALYGPRPWEKALADTLAAPTSRVVSGGDAGGQPFYCAAVFGAPSLWADTREALRHGDFVQATAGAVTAIRRHSEALDYKFGDEPPGDAEAVVVMCPLVSKEMAPDEQALEASALDPETAVAMLGLAFRTMLDDWRSDSSVKLAKVKRVLLSGHGRVPAILDGERADFDRTVAISFVPSAFRAIVPSGSGG